MTKVEELRDEVVIYSDPWQRDSVIRVLDSLIAAARAEGAEQMRERIRKEAVDEHWGSIGEDVRRICTVPVSVLDPKERP